MKEIPLHGGKKALVDDEDYDYLSGFKWYVVGCAKYTYYAWRNITTPEGKRTTIRMHREILKVQNSHIFVDHFDGDGLNNQKHNLRQCSPKENQGNRRITSGQSKFKGVKPVGTRWAAKISIGGNTTHLGIYDTEDMAAAAYNRKAKEVFGEFAYLNNVEEDLFPEHFFFMDPKNKCCRIGITSKYKGVDWSKAKQRWRVRLWDGNTNRHVGMFKDEIAAAEAYNKAAIAKYGPEVFQNNIPK